MRLPEWIRTKYNYSDLRGMKSMLRNYGVNTVCEEAKCPNKAQCFSRPTATFMILGSACTRNCGFCSVESAEPSAVDGAEPERVAWAAKQLRLRYVVLTSVTRDDLADGGAGHFAETIKTVKEEIPGVKVEVLTPDFSGNISALKTVLYAGPDVFNHNVETVPSFYPTVRPQADYKRSVGLLREAKRIAPQVATKSGLMLGFGERFDEVLDVMKELRSADCDLLTIGQYLRPSRRNLPVKEYVPEETFQRLATIGRNMGFRHVASSPLTRSSMNADEMYEIEEGVGNV